MYSLSYRRLAIGLLLQHTLVFAAPFERVSNAKIQSLGEIVMNVDISETTQPILLRVADNTGPSLLGQDILE